MISIESMMILECIYVCYKQARVIKYDSFMNEKNEQRCCFFFWHILPFMNNVYSIACLFLFYCRYNLDNIVWKNLYNKYNAYLYYLLLRSNLIKLEITRILIWSSNPILTFCHQSLGKIEAKGEQIFFSLKRKRDENDNDNNNIIVDRPTRFIIENNKFFFRLLNNQEKNDDD